jgi:Ca-activated chloride channel family protein
MRFANYYWLFLVLALPVLAWIQTRKKNPDKILYSSIESIKSIYIKKDYRKLVLLVLRLSSLFLLILGFARPQLGLVTSESSTRGVDIILCMDTSPSMRALDFNPKNRLDVAKEAAKEFVKNRKHDRIGIVVFAGMSFTQCPLTTDHAALFDFVDKTEIGMTQVDMTAIGTAIMTSLNRLKQSTAKSKVIILLTDGRSNAGEIDPVTAAKTAQSLDVKIYTIGCAVEGQSLYPVQHPVFGTQYVYVQGNELNETELKEIAGLTGGLYFRVKTRQGMFDVYNQINKLEKTEIKTKSYTEYRELYKWFVLVALILFLVELVLTKVYFLKIP